MQQRDETLTQSTGRALSWSYLGSFVRLFLGFGVNILLTRLLGPRPFGEIAVAMLLFSFGNLLAGIGVGTALIQKPNLQDRDIRFCFTSQMVVGFLVTVTVALSAPVWSTFFHQPDLTPLLRAISPLFVLQSFGTTSIALLNRAQNTRAIQTASIASYVVSFLGIAVPMALLGFGVWSLAAAYLSQALVNSLLVYVRVRHSLIPLLHRDGMGLFRFGATVLGANLCNWGISNLDNTVVGRFAGGTALGLYSRAFTLAALPAESIIQNLLGVLLPAFSRVQGETERLYRVYIAAVSLVALVLFPPFCAMATVPGVVVLGLYGPKWAGAVWLFQPLALAIPINAIMALSGPILASRGKPEKEMRFQFLVVLVAIAAYSLSVRHSVLWLSWTVLAVYLVRFTLLTRTTLTEIEGRWSDVALGIWPAFALAAIGAGTAGLVNMALPATPMWMRLAIVSATSAASVLACLGLGRKILLQPILANVPQLESFLRAKLPQIYPLTTPEKIL